MKTKLFLTGLLLIAFTSATLAQQTPVVDVKQKTQKARVVQGVKSGELTKRETKKLARQQAHIRRTERRAKADGKVTGKERRELRRKQRRASKNIYHKKHNFRNRN